MTEKEIYIDIAKRFLTSSQALISNKSDIPEVVVFNCYHSFESIGGAFNLHFGQDVKRKHGIKLNSFVSLYNHHKITRIDPKIIAALATFLHSIRNKCLYPEYDGNAWKAPQHQITIKQAEDLLKKINGIVITISKAI